MRPRSDLVFGVKIGTLVRCIKEPDCAVWTNGQIKKSIQVPLVGRDYRIRGNVLLPAIIQFKYDRGVILEGVPNDSINIVAHLKCEPFFPCECFMLVGSRP